MKTKIYKYLDNIGFVSLLYLIKSRFLNHSIRIKELEDRVRWLQDHAILDSVNINDEGGDG